MRFKFRFLLMLALVTFTLQGSAAFAQITVALTPGTASVTPNSSLTLLLSIFNGGTEDLEVAGFGGNSASPDLTIDDSLFQSDALNLVLAPNATYTQDLIVFSSAAAPGGPFEVSYSVVMTGVVSGAFSTSTGMSQVTIAGPQAASEPTTVEYGFLCALLVCGAKRLRRNREQLGYFCTSPASVKSAENSL